MQPMYLCYDGSSHVGMEEPTYVLVCGLGFVLVGFLIQVL